MEKLQLFLAELLEEFNALQQDIYALIMGFLADLKCKKYVRFI